MAITRKYESADGLLRLLIDHHDNETTVGFEGFPWHTHADLLVPDYGLSREEACKNFVREILENRVVIVISRVAGIVKDVRVTDTPADEMKYASSDEEIELRYWNGTYWNTA